MVRTEDSYYGQMVRTIDFEFEDVSTSVAESQAELLFFSLHVCVYFS